MTIQELFILSNQELQRVVSKIKDEQWDIDMPEGTTVKPVTLGESIRYHIYDDAWVPDVLAGKTKDEVGDQYEHLLSTENVRADFSDYNQRAIDAVLEFNDLDKTTHLSYGDFPARDYLQHITSFRAFRSYDIAKLIGIDTTMKPEFVKALLDVYTPLVDGYRQMGVFPPALKVSETADQQTRLLAMVGRK